MKIKELIDILKKEDQEKDVYFRFRYFIKGYFGDDIIPIGGYGYTKIEDKIIFYLSQPDEPDDELKWFDLESLDEIDIVEKERKDKILLELANILFKRDQNIDPLEAALVMLEDHDWDYEKILKLLEVQ